MKKFILTLLLLPLLFFSCTTTKYIPVEKVRTEYIHKTDSVYLYDSINTYIEKKGDTVFINKYKYKVKEVYKTDTVHTSDTIPVICPITEIKYVNLLNTWQKVLMYLGGVGVLILIGFLIKKLRLYKVWKLLF